MKTTIYFIKKLIENLFWFHVVLIGMYLFLAICNWTLSVGLWNGFSRFLLGVTALVMSIVTFQAMETVIRNVRNLREQEKARRKNEVKNRNL
jgi:uncharacterized membrane protein